MKTYEIDNSLYLTFLDRRSKCFYSYPWKLNSTFSNGDSFTQLIKDNIGENSASYFKYPFEGNVDYLYHNYARNENAFHSIYFNRDKMLFLMLRYPEIYKILDNHSWDDPHYLESKGY